MKIFLAVAGLASAMTLSSCGMFSTKGGGKKMEQNSSALAATWADTLVKGPPPVVQPSWI